MPPRAAPDPHRDVTTIEFDVAVRDQRESATEEAGTLWVAYKGRVRLDHVEVTSTELGRAGLLVSGVMGEHARRNFTGCLEDATLDRVWATVISMTTLPVDPPAPE